ncbi:MAG: UDP-N-acetylglucosamine 2-epimerase (non-hydrolyzing) [Crenarchaeota archaeon]|nr:UDP-N-acetylglucosamine 2-epimerase (non-hydrolyzing) [Thermoproteota archaeon]
MKPVVVVTGTRPEIIKMAPILRALKKNKTPTVFVHCGQHYDYNMAQQFIENLELTAPDYNFKIKATSPGAQTGQIIAQMDKLLEETNPAIVLVEGDTNTVLAAAIAANKRKIPVGHVEAGLRSFDLRMPEEHNRRLTDNISDFLFAPTNIAKVNLENEKTWGKIFVTGNTVIDAVNEHLPIAERKSEILDKIKFKKYILATAHRAENVDDIKILRNFIEAFTESPLPVVYPIHPRTKKRLCEGGLYDMIEKTPNLQVLAPLGYLDFLIAMKNSELILTDSGGIQEEATAPAIKKQVLVMRLSTERPEAVEAGFAQIVGTDKQKILSAIKSALERKHKLPDESPFGDGKAAERIVDIVEKEFFVD